MKITFLTEMDSHLENVLKFLWNLKPFMLMQDATALKTLDLDNIAPEIIHIFIILLRGKSVSHVSIEKCFSEKHL